MPRESDVYALLDDHGIDTLSIGSLTHRTKECMYLIGFYSEQEAQVAAGKPIYIGSKTVYLDFPRENKDYKIEGVVYCTDDADITHAFEQIRGFKVTDVTRQLTKESYIQKSERRKPNPRSVRCQMGRVFIKGYETEEFEGRMPDKVTVRVEGEEYEDFQILTVGRMTKSRPPRPPRTQASETNGARTTAASEANGARTTAP